MIVADTSVLIDFLKGRSTGPAEKLKRLEAEGTPVAIPMICAQELLQGARDEKEWGTLVEYLGTQHLMTPGDPWAAHTGAARIFYDCRKKGFTVSGPVGCLIAQLVLDSKGTLLHDDDDFERIAKVRHLKTTRR